MSVILDTVNQNNKADQINNAYKADVAAFILFYEKLNQTIECIQSVLSSGISIYILNNGSTASSVNALKKYCKKYDSITIFDSDKNLGVAGGRNFLLNHAREEWLLFLDNDIKIKTLDWFEKFLKHVDQHSDVEVFIPKLFSLPENMYCINRSLTIVKSVVARRGEIQNNIVNVFPGGASIIRTSVFRRLGFYDDKMFVGFEDYELCIRGILTDSPVKAMIIDDIEFIHEHKKFSKKSDIEAVQIRYDYKEMAKSALRIKEKHNLTIDEGDIKSWSEGQINLMTWENTWERIINFLKCRH